MVVGTDQAGVPENSEMVAYRRLPSAGLLNEVAGAELLVRQKLDDSATQRVSEQLHSEVTDIRSRGDRGVSLRGGRLTHRHELI